MMNTNYYGEIKKIKIINFAYEVEYMCGIRKIYKEEHSFITNFIATHAAKQYGDLIIYK